MEIPGFLFKAHRLCVSLNSRLESNKEDEEGLAELKRDAAYTQFEPQPCSNVGVGVGVGERERYMEGLR